MFRFDPSLLPSLRTRKALLVLDAQVDFVSAEGALPVTKPAGFVQRLIDVAVAFRQSGTGDVIWVRSEFEQHRPVEDDQILTSDIPVTNYMRRSAAAMASRRPGSNPENDPEAFLSEGVGQEGQNVKPECVRAGMSGSAFAADIATVMDVKRDSVLTKSHYSAFQSGQLLQLLRGRVATELYVCGVLTNVSIHATALDAARHGFSMTLIDDCCGYRNPTRHGNAIRHLVQLTGCETTTAEELTAMLNSKRQAQNQSSPLPSVSTSLSSTPAAPKLTVGGAHASGLSPREERLEDGLVRDTSGAQSRGSAHNSLSRALEDMKLHDDPPVATRPSPVKPPADQLPVQSLVGPGNGRRGGNTPGSPSCEPTLRDHANPIGDTPCKPTVDPEPAPVSDAATASGASQLVPGRDGDGRGEKVIDDSGACQSPPPSKDKSSPISEPRGRASTPEKVEDSSDEDVAVTNIKGIRPWASEPLCEGDTTIFHAVLPESLEAGIFFRLRDEVRWLRMSHQGGEVPRLVCVQGEIDDEGSMPVYRHPADESPPLVPFSPTVLAIKSEVEKLLGHPVNHALIQFYRSGSDYISEHSDKTLDIVHDSFIANVSLGAERTMVFRTKRPDKDPSQKHVTTSKGGDDGGSVQGSMDDRQGPSGKGATNRTVIRARLPHNSLCRMGLRTNERWLHSIRQDKRQAREKSEEELAFYGARISLTFRRIGTFLDRDGSVIWGQGATCKTREGARPVVNGQTEAAVRMLKGFGTENHSTEFDWGAVYGGGFDVLHTGSAPRFFSSRDHVVNMRIQLMLAEYGVACASGSMGPVSVSAPPISSPSSGRDDAGPASRIADRTAETESCASTDFSRESVPVRFADNDPARSVIQGDIAIMLYLESVYGPNVNTTAHPALARKFTCFQQALYFLDKWRSISHKRGTGGGREGDCGGDDVGAERRTRDLGGEAQPVVGEGTATRQPSSSQLLGPIARDLAQFDAWASEAAAASRGSDDEITSIVGGSVPSIADFTLWPVLHEMASLFTIGQSSFRDALGRLEMNSLAHYYETFGRRDSVRAVLTESALVPLGLLPSGNDEERHGRSRSGS